MPKLSDIRRIIPEDFEEDFQSSAEKIAGSYNEFADELYEVVNGQLDFDNLARAKVSLDISFDATGKPTVNSNISSKLSYVSMLYIGKIQNLTNPSSKITQVPYLDWTYKGNGIVGINYGVGFISGNKYRIVIELIQ